MRKLFTSKNSKVNTYSTSGLESSSRIFPKKVFQSPYQQQQKDSDKSELFELEAVPMTSLAPSELKLALRKSHSDSSTVKGILKKGIVYKKYSKNLFMMGYENDKFQQSKVPLSTSKHQATSPTSKITEFYNENRSSPYFTSIDKVIPSNLKGKGRTLSVAFKKQKQTSLSPFSKDKGRTLPAVSKRKELSKKNSSRALKDGEILSKSVLSLLEDKIVSPKLKERGRTVTVNLKKNQTSISTVPKPKAKATSHVYKDADKITSSVHTPNRNKNSTAHSTQRSTVHASKVINLPPIRKKRKTSPITLNEKETSTPHPRKEVERSTPPISKNKASALPVKMEKNETNTSLVSREKVIVSARPDKKARTLRPSPKEKPKVTLRPVKDVEKITPPVLKEKGRTLPVFLKKKHTSCSQPNKTIKNYSPKRFLKFITPRDLVPNYDLERKTVKYKRKNEDDDSSSDERALNTKKSAKTKVAKFSPRKKSSIRTLRPKFIQKNTQQNFYSSD